MIGLRSAELAQWAGVTVRTLRHYHQSGILPEPDRSHNGYREYTVHDLVRVLRIRRLAALGIALDDMPPLLDDDAPDASATLDALDAELTAQIERLTRQRDLIAQVRAHATSPDLPPELAPFLAIFAGTYLSPSLAAYDRDQTVLLAHLAGEEGMPQLERLYERLSAPDVAPAVTDLAEQFSRIDESTTDEQLASLVDAFVPALGPLIADVSRMPDPLSLASSVALFTEYSTASLNAQQLRCLAMLESALTQ